MEASRLQAAPNLIDGKTRLDLASRAYTLACARLKALEAEANAAFKEYHEARERLHAEHGITSDLTLSPGVAAAYSTFKQELGRAEARRIVDEDQQ